MPPPGIALYFIALLPPPEIQEQLQSFKEHFYTAYQSKGALNSPPHITLHMPFQWKEAKENKLVESLKRFAKGNTSFEVQLQDFGCFAPRVIFSQVNESEPLRVLQQQLHRFVKIELNLFNAQYRDQRFHPHITLVFRDLKKDRFALAWQEFSERKYEADFKVNSFTLLKHNGKIWNSYTNFDF
jgi:2'-5' RNA ligase